MAIVVVVVSFVHYVDIVDYKSKSFYLYLLLDIFSIYNDRHRSISMVSIRVDRVIAVERS